MLITYGKVKMYRIETIRSQSSKSVMIGYEGGSTTKCQWALNDGLINPIMLKI